MNTSTESIKLLWENELGMEIENDVWEICLKNIHNCSINVRHNVVQFKTWHRSEERRVGKGWVSTCRSRVWAVCLSQH